MLILTRLAVRVLIQRLPLNISSNTIITNKEVFISARVPLLHPLLLSNINLQPATANVSGVTPEHLRDQDVAGVLRHGQVHGEVVHDAGLQGGDVPVPQVLNDLCKVDIFSESPGDVLTHSWGILILAGGSLNTLLMEYLGIQTRDSGLVRIHDHGALVTPDLGHLSKFIIPLQRWQTRNLKQ